MRTDLVITMPKYLKPKLESLKGIEDRGSSTANWLIAKHSLFEMFDL